MADTIPGRDVRLTTRVALEHSRISRLTLLRRGGAAALGLGLMPTLLAACGGGDEAAAPEASGTIDYLSWTGYDIPDPMKAWKTENAVDVKPTYIANHDDIGGRSARRTRPVLVSALETALTKREATPKRKHGNIPL